MTAGVHSSVLKGPVSWLVAHGVSVVSRTWAWSRTGRADWRYGSGVVELASSSVSAGQVVLRRARSCVVSAVRPAVRRPWSLRPSGGCRSRSVRHRSSPPVPAVAHAAHDPGRSPVDLIGRRSPATLSPWRTPWCARSAARRLLPRWSEAPESVHSTQAVTVAYNAHS